MYKRMLAGLLGLAAVAVVSATTASSAGLAGPGLTLLYRAPLVVQGAHFRAHEHVRLFAASSTDSATARVTTTRQGRFVARFPNFAVPMCVRVVVRASGGGGDRATLVIDPAPGSSGLPCGL